MWVANFGHGWATTKAWREQEKRYAAWVKRYRERDREEDPNDPQPEIELTTEVCEFPNMEAIQKVAWDKRSGVIVVSVPKTDKI